MKWQTPRLQRSACSWQTRINSIASFWFASCKVTPNFTLKVIRASQTIASRGSQFPRRCVALGGQYSVWSNQHNRHHSRDAATISKAAHHSRCRGSEQRANRGCISGGVCGLFSVEHGSIKGLLKCIHSVYEGQVWANNAQIICLVESARMSR
jgi:hypothetical protein